jgi:hypothetical protein
MDANQLIPERIKPLTASEYCVLIGNAIESLESESCYFEVKIVLMSYSLYHLLCQHFSSISCPSTIASMQILGKKIYRTYDLTDYNFEVY